jgi:SAM-dependent methyltransferase
LRPIYRRMYDLAYRLPVTLWGDSRVPPEVTRLTANTAKTGNALELGCGTGTYSLYLAQQGFAVTGVDFSPTAIRKALKKAALAAKKPEFLVHDVTRLDILDGPFDVALDVGCFHCLNAADQQRYASELIRLMKPGGTLLIWAMDSPPPGGRALSSPAILEKTFAPGFKLDRVESSRRHGAPSKWYWLVR